MRGNPILVFPPVRDNASLVFDLAGLPPYKIPVRKYHAQIKYQGGITTQGDIPERDYPLQIKYQGAVILSRPNTRSVLSSPGMRYHLGGGTGAEHPPPPFLQAKYKGGGFPTSDQILGQGTPFG